VSVSRSWQSARGRDLLTVSVAGQRADGEAAAQSRAAIGRALDAVAAAGFRPEHIVRSRLWARDAVARAAASDERRALLAGDKRGGSASFFDPERFAGDGDMIIDIIALRAPAAARKTIVEYEPPIAPPLFVSLDGMVFLSGNTDISPAFADQIARIGDKIDRTLAKTGATWPQVVTLSAFLAKSVDPATARAAIARRFPGLACPIEINGVVGFSAPEKLIEIETTADLNRAR
jgi:enamine deaminase RidA (YjgF/YER057c/UK114 family)